MREIGSLAGEVDARRFADYLLTQGIQSTVEPSREGWAVWVHDENALAAAERHLAHFREHPADERYQGAARSAAQLRDDEVRKRQQAADNAIDVRARWRNTAAGWQPVTTILIAATLVVGVFSKLGGERNRLVGLLLFAGLEEPDAADPHPPGGFERIAKGEVWRLFTPMFLHFGLLHLLFNMFWMQRLGGSIEARKGAGSVCF